jgi:hypothetical protein|tara:strand:- start:465 stop:695 length:231 start_codon:yes stop_codon:yes gene_type:complete
MHIDLKTAPVLQELISDLETELSNKITELAMIEGEIAPRYIIHGLEKEIEMIESVLERVEAQQELIDLKQNSISLN